jgi:putative membrane protein
MTMMHALTPLLASANSWHGHWHHGWWIVFPILWLILFATAIALFWRRGRNTRDGGHSARRILGERFARGEIDADEYRNRLAELP